MTKIITLYNHKGGVSKTTTTYHLAHALVESQGKKVLVVDADPQCNITELFLFKIIEELDEQEAQGEKYCSTRNIPERCTLASTRWRKTRCRC
ncbi:ParA family protein [Pseudomonas paraeruginosa]|uniref:ParA family protein n=1 Tax=Pseudomonas paraeruginosa TaxID=2994495 RepID=UPI0039FD4041